ncbi:MAG: HD domain-containing protein [Candidatus Colwellbacteria bacterium]|nr:HD domain-containing protein [Candidatus Colwellbacteria bacterium]
MKKDIVDKIPNEAKEVLQKLEEAGFQAYVVGGAVRDILYEKVPKDWDIATDARPEVIQVIFPDSVYENAFGTVGVKTRSDDKSVAVIEVTTFRKEGSYSDRRHPDEVQFADTIEEDLSRRDFTVNAMAMTIRGELTDPFDGRSDISKKSIRAVGDPERRFDEDALRLVRAVRFAAELGFEIEDKTLSAIRDKASLLKEIASERIREEFVKILMSDGNGPAWGVVELENLGLLSNIIPELRDGIGVGQNKHHIYTVWEHNLRALDYTAKEGASLEVRLAALLHDVGKPRSKVGDGPDSTFHNHEVIGGKMAVKILERLHFSKKTTERVSHLVRHHLFYYNVGEVTEAGVRRFISRVGEENIDDLMKIREADRIGSGVPKAVPYKNRHLKFMIDKVRRDPIAPKMLALNGNELMGNLGIEPGPRIGMILSILLESVLDDPSLNNKDFLSERARELNVMGDDELRLLSLKARDAKSEFEAGIEAEIKKRHKVS